MANPPYGYWTFNNYQNALVGAESTYDYTPDGRRVTVKDPDNPAVMEDEFILYALRTSRRARDDYRRLFPSLDAVSQNRLFTLMEANHWAWKLIEPDQTFMDLIQHKETTSGVRVRLPRPST